MSFIWHYKSLFVGLLPKVSAFCDKVVLITNQKPLPSIYGYSLFSQPRDNNVEVRMYEVTKQF